MRGRSKSIYIEISSQKKPRGIGRPFGEKKIDERGEIGRRRWRTVETSHMIGKFLITKRYRDELQIVRRNWLRKMRIERGENIDGNTPSMPGTVFTKKSVARESDFRVGDIL